MFKKNLITQQLFRVFKHKKKSTHKSKSLEELYSHKELVEARRNFDPSFYIEVYPDVRKSGMDPFQHYMFHGWKENRRPNSNFHATDFSAANPDTLPEGCPLVNFAMINHKNDAAISNVAHSPPNSREHESATGNSLYTILKILENINIISHLNKPNNQERLDTYLLPFFSSKYYRERHSLPATISEATCLTRYLSNDLECGATPSPAFDSEFYISQLVALGEYIDPDITNPVLHWLSYGIDNRISPNRLFKEINYLRLNPDLDNYPHWSFEHFLRHGIDEGRQILPTAHICSTQIFRVDSNYRSALDYTLQTFNRGAFITSELSKAEQFQESNDFLEIFAEINRFEPEVGSPNSYTFHATAPLHDASFYEFRSIVELLPKDRKFESIIFMPFCRLGGADYVAGVLAHAEHNQGKKVIIIRTDSSDWERPDWFPQNIVTVDLSRHLAVLPQTTITRVLYEVTRLLCAKNVFNINSLQFFRTIERFGRQLSRITKLHCYYFCSDKDNYGYQDGYPVKFFSNILTYLSTAITDNRTLANDLSARYQLPNSLLGKICTIYTPTSVAPLPPDGKRGLPNFGQPVRVFWGGRLDRQKRFDLLIEVAKRMPIVRFDCWGKAVLEKDRVFENLPPNISIHPPFQRLDDLPLSEATVWLYTSEWDGLPTVLIEVAARAIPIVASIVGGVGELVDESTGWPVLDWEKPQAYVDAIYEVAGSPSERYTRLLAMQRRLQDAHSKTVFLNSINKITG